jgi:hypothetical protein
MGSVRRVRHRHLSNVGKTKTQDAISARIGMFPFGRASSESEPLVLLALPNIQAQTDSLGLYGYCQLMRILLF